MSMTKRVTTPGRPVLGLAAALCLLLPARSGAQLTERATPFEAASNGELVYCLAYSPNGKTLAAGLAAGLHATIKLLDAASGKERFTLNAVHGPTTPGERYLFSRGRVTAMSFRPDGKTLAACYQYGPVKLWDVATGKEQATFDVNPYGAEGSLAYSPDGNTLAIVDERNIIHFWDAATGKERAGVNTPSQGHYHVLYSPDGKTLACCETATGDITLWDVAAGKERGSIRPGTKAMTALAYSPDGKLLAAGVGLPADPLRLYDAATGVKLASLAGPKDPVWRVAFSPDGRSLASGCQSRLSLWDVAAAKEKAGVEFRKRSVTALAYSPDGKTLAVGVTPERAPDDGKFLPTSRAAIKLLNVER
jgi:WD40 repeat protein